ncbi:DUF192 domain-containing protein [Natrialba sp. SSL1]|uniref:DUF192 domain-containing protein n=1 Tax=Natrialba sp. SSL1 TaxID=1869245 RepID=UPI0008F84B16|nr:DUF192 domain-containing protein [Natrialba sp. SSL1]OIB57355.1 hypothetical protein BBD46_02420 [Natrialba sp. SSL1]
MTFRRSWQFFFIVALLVLAGVIGVLIGVIPEPWSQDRATVEVSDEDEQKTVVDVVVADTPSERYTGLSDYDSLEDGEGMLFVHATEDERTYVMRDMDFDIDIIFIGADGEITTIHHARAPEPGEDGEDLRYTGQAKWVLEVPRGYANETGISEGDDISIKYH